MRIIDIIKNADWQADGHRKTAETLFEDAAEYMRRVEAHIYKGNEIRADSFMDFAEKQDEISRLDRIRTEAHNRMLASFYPFLDLLREQPGFDESSHRLDNRTQIADFVAGIAFEAMGAEPSSRAEGNVRDELAEKLHRGEFTCEQIRDELSKII